MPYCCFQCFNTHVARKVIHEKIQKINTFEVQLHEFLINIWEPAKNFVLDSTKAINDGK